MLPVETTEELRDWIQKELDKRNWSMREASLKAGMSDSRLGQILRGQPPGIEACVAIAKLFNVKPEYVMHMAGYPVEDPTETDPLIDAIARRIGEIENDDVRRKVIQVLDALLAAEGF